MALIKCKECKKEISDSAKVCIHCGCPIKKEYTCEECGNKLAENEKFCAKCGKEKKQDIKERIMNNKRTLLTKKNILLVGIISLFIIITLFATTKRINLKKVYNKIGCTTYYCTLASDNSYLEIDSNPNDLDDTSSLAAIAMVKQANIEFGFNDSLYTKMGKTRALDGTQHEENKYIKVSWTYHPNNGLEVVYEKK